MRWAIRWSTRIWRSWLGGAVQHVAGGGTVRLRFPTGHLGRRRLPERPASPAWSEIVRQIADGTMADDHSLAPRPVPVCLNQTEPSQLDPHGPVGDAMCSSDLGDRVSRCDESLKVQLEIAGYVAMKIPTSASQIAAVVWATPSS